MLTGTEPAVSLERTGRGATITLDRPPLNILDLATLAELETVVASLAAEGDAAPKGGGEAAPATGPLQVVVVRSANPRAFSAGVAVEDHTPERIGEMLTRFHGALRRLRDLPAVSIAEVRGHCLGGGMELAAACDLVLAADDATFGQPEIALGCFPPWAAATYPALLGGRRTLELLVTGRKLDAAEAERIGFVHRVVPAEELEAAVVALVAEITRQSAAVTRLTKRAVRAGEAVAATGGAEAGGQEAAIAECERLYLEELATTADMEEGLAAFLAKRRPEWKHR
ncbi:MAG TPA: enoyl-CoA hydratase/isomerase family protein [Thermoanaerobaculia bacterium]|nr:enoyl-CoA hydratase/isomerase family protein [Thermoanaerobaculia bacterium]